MTYTLKESEAAVLRKLFKEHEHQLIDSPVESICTLEFRYGDDHLSTSLDMLGTLNGRINGQMVLMKLTEAEKEALYQVVSQYFYHEITGPDLGITLTAENVTPTGCTLVCTQSAGSVTGELTAAQSYWLSVYDNGVWRELEPNQDHAHLIATPPLEIGLNGETRWNIDWTQLYGVLSPGQYRITRSFRESYTSGGFWDDHFSAEFTIE